MTGGSVGRIYGIECVDKRAVRHRGEQGVVCQVRGVESTAITCFPPFTADRNRDWEQSLTLHCDPHIFASAVRLALRLLTTTYRNLSPSHRDVNSLFDCPINPLATEPLLSLVGETERLSLVVKS
ncbi:hypothetical protein [Caballeronia sp. M23-90]